MPKISLLERSSWPLTLSLEFSAKLHQVLQVEEDWLELRETPDAAQM